MSHDRCTHGCSEYNLISRRRFLGLSGTALAAASLPAWLPRVAYAASATSGRDVLVSIFLRGGADGLSLCVPHGDPGYYALRPNLAIPRPGSGAGAARDLDGFFGLAPAMAPLLEAYDDRALLFVQACGSIDPTRSHFNAMYFMEVGQPSPPASLFTGWLGRHLATVSPATPGTTLRGVGLGYGLQRSLVGGPATVPVRDIAALAFEGDSSSLSARRVALDALYAGTAEPLKSAAAGTAHTIDLLARVGLDNYQPSGGATYPDNDFGYALKSTAALIRAEVGVEAVAVDYGGWDTHEEQGPLDGGMAELMTGLAEGLAAFYRDLASAGRNDVLAVVQSEFGRNVAENASLGTDHGHGNTMLVLGGHVAGGRVLGRWPGLDDGHLYEGQDLAITTDYRDILTEIVTKRLGNPNYKNVFPDPAYTPIDHGVIAPALFPGG